MMSLATLPQIIVIYLALCAVAGFMGRHRRIGFWGFFFLSILVTPAISGLFIFAAAPGAPRRVARKRR